MTSPCHNPDGFMQLGVEVAPYYGFGDIASLKDLGPEVCISGFIGDVYEALKLLDKPIPESLDYPEELKPFLHRHIYRSTLEEIRRTTKQWFVKPVEQKLFTGFVWDASEASRRAIVTCPDSTEIWVSEVLRFVSEYRCFVLDGKLIDAKHYKGDWSIPIDRSVVERAVEQYKSGPSTYVLDFGAYDESSPKYAGHDGHYHQLTALVEANDAYALGHYGLNSVLYARMIASRWEELING